MSENTKKNPLSSKRKNYSVANTNIITSLVELVQNTMFNSHWNPIKHKPLCDCNAQRPSNNITKETRKTNAYNDNLFDRLAINHLSQA